MASDTDKTESEDLVSKEFIGLKEFFSLFVKIVGALAGFAAIFVLLGYTIILSFIIRVQLYGLANFPQEFYKEATLKFMGDINHCYQKHPVCFIPITVVILGVYAFVKWKPHLSDIFKTVGSFAASVFILLTILVTLKLEILPERFLSITEFNKVFLFMISIPVAAGVFLYLALHFRGFTKQPYRVYSLMIFLFLGLSLSIPVSYGENIFDIDIFPVIEIDYSEGVKVESLIKLKKEINSQGEGPLLFLMGHTTGKEVFFDNQTLSPPAKMVLVERDLIKFMKVSRKNVNTLRNLLVKHEVIDPVYPSGTKMETEELSKKEIRSLIEGSIR